MDTTALILHLRSLTLQNKEEVEAIQSFSDEFLNWKENPTQWSILECIEHLNRYGDFYLPELENRIKSAKYPASTTFKSGWLGGYFAKSMLPKENLNKMKTFRSMNPLNSKLNRSVLDHFIVQQDRLLLLLEQAKEVNLNKTKTSLSISKWIKLKLGDGLKIVIFHNVRHVVQAKNSIKQQNRNEK